MNHVAKRNQQGFTLIELLLAMSFIAVLLLAIAMTIIQVGAMYTKGSTLKEVNQASRDIADDLRRSVSASESIDVTKDFVLVPSPTNAIGGRLCLGTTSYIWNYDKAIKANDINIAGYDAAANGTRPTGPIRLIKVPDSGKYYCTPNGVGAVPRNVRGDDAFKAQELLNTGDRQLGIHQMNVITDAVSGHDSSTGQQLYTVTFTIGTGSEALNATQTACAAVTAANSDPLYCNVQQFTIVLRAGNKV